MLTEIEWWGGLIFIWMLVSFVFFYSDMKHEPKYKVPFLAFIFSYFCAAILLALYFYEIESLMIQKAYLGVFALGLLSTLIIVVWPETERMKANEIAEKAEVDYEESGKLALFIGEGLILFPLMISLCLTYLKLKNVNIVSVFFV